MAHDEGERAGVIEGAGEGQGYARRERPALDPSVLARRYAQADGGEAGVYLLGDDGAPRAALGEREWAVLAAADGTRDAEGLALAAQRRGARVSAAQVRAFVQGLDEAGLLAREPPRALAVGDADDEARVCASRGDRPLVPLARFALRCDGRGQCCRTYTTVVFTAEEVARARAFAPAVRDAGRDAGRAFLPLAGSTHALRAVSLDEGACAYLRRDGGCAVHAAGGPSAKPEACLRYPTQCTDVGAEVRVWPALECACVLASGDEAEDPAGWGSGAAPAPLVEPSARSARDLSPRLALPEVPASVLVTRAAGRERFAPRAAVVALCDALRDQVSDAACVATALEALAAALEALEALEGGARASALVRAAVTASAPRALDEAGRSAAAELARRCARRAEADAQWRGRDDLARRANRWLAAAALRCAAGEPDAAGPPAHERLAVRAAAHGLAYALLGPRVPLASALRAAALRLRLARALPRGLEALGEGAAGDASRGAHAALDETLARRYPLALVEALWRGHGLGAGLAPGVAAAPSSVEEGASDA